MSRSEMSSFDSCFLGPFLLIANQYLGVIVDEYFMLWFCFVSSSFSANMLQLKHTLVLTFLLTGRVTLNRHLAVMKIRTDPICSVCGEEDETSVHFLGKCPATIMARHSILGSYFLRLDELCCIQPHALMRFVRASKRFK